MLTRTRVAAVSSILTALCVAAAGGCGARSELSQAGGAGGLDEATGGSAVGAAGGTGGVAGGAGGVGGVAGSGGGAGSGGEGGAPIACLPGETLACGSDVGACAMGTRFCEDGVFGECTGGIQPVDELCNDLDDDCDGIHDNGFGLGQACDGPDSDLCADDVMTCGGCTIGDEDLEVCNGVDDNCNGTVDADCAIGDCQPGLLVTGSTPSNPACIDFPVEAGSTGAIQYPCAGGPVSAVLGGIPFTGSVTNGQVLLTGTAQMIGPDGCLWQFDHTIEGTISSGQLFYFYEETLLSPPPGCWFPCTETGTVQVEW